MGSWHSDPSMNPNFDLTFQTHTLLVLSGIVFEHCFHPISQILMHIFFLWLQILNQQIKCAHSERLTVADVYPKHYCQTRSYMFLFSTPSISFSFFLKKKLCFFKKFSTQTSLLYMRQHQGHRTWWTRAIQKLEENYYGSFFLTGLCYREHAMGHKLGALSSQLTQQNRHHSMLLTSGHAAAPTSLSHYL